jgi:hypothetical protein
LKYKDKEFTFISDNIYKLLQKECIEELKTIIEYGNFFEVDNYAWDGAGYGYNYLVIYENKNGIKFTCNTHFEGDMYIFYIEADKKFTNNLEYIYIINNIKQNISNLWNNKLLDIAKSENLKYKNTFLC